MAERCTRLLLMAACFLAIGRMEAQTAPPVDPRGPLNDSRAALVSMMKEGQLVAFDEALGTVTFRPLKPADTPHEPGPMEDEVIASALRAAAAGDAGLRGLKVTAECQAGALRVNAGPAATLAQTAGLITLALNEAGVRQVSATLPKSLKMRPAKRGALIRP